MIYGFWLVQLGRLCGNWTTSDRLTVPMSAPILRRRIGYDCQCNSAVQSWYNVLPDASPAIGVTMKQAPLMKRYREVERKPSDVAGECLKEISEDFRSPHASGLFAMVRGQSSLSAGGSSQVFEKPALACSIGPGVLY